MTLPSDFSDLLRGRFKRGGRAPGIEIDCAGIVMECSQRRGKPIDDPWARVERLWRESRTVPDGVLGPGWRRVSCAPADDHILIMASGIEQGVGYVMGGYVWTASPSIGPVALPLDRVEVLEVWEHDSAAR